MQPINLLSGLHVKTDFMYMYSRFLLPKCPKNGWKLLNHCKIYLKRDSMQCNSAFETVLNKLVPYFTHVIET